MRPILFLSALATLLLCGSAVGQQRTFTGPEGQYVQLLKYNQILKAKEVAELGNVNPHNILGREISDYIWVEPYHFSIYMKWPMINYFIEELKISPNTKFANSNRSLMAEMCAPSVVRNFGLQDSVETRVRVVKEEFVDKYKYMLDHGGSPKPIPAAAGFEKGKQPLPACLDAYYEYWHQVGGDPERSSFEARAGLREVIELLLVKGAPIKYVWDDKIPVFISAMGYDQDLLGVLEKHGAHITDTLNLSQPTTCGDPHLRLSVLNSLPEPNDRDTMRAEAYLGTFVGYGGNIKAKLPIGSNCSSRFQTLKEKALGAGQLGYAKMILELEKRKPGQLIGAKRGEDDPD